MRTFLNRIKNETLNKIKISLENLWQRTIQLSGFFFNTHWCSFPSGSVCLELAESAVGRVVLLQLLIYTRWSSQHDGLGCHAPMIKTYKPFVALYCNTSLLVLATACVMLLNGARPLPKSTNELIEQWKGEQKIFNISSCTHHFVYWPWAHGSWNSANLPLSQS